MLLKIRCCCGFSYVSDVKLNFCEYKISLRNHTAMNEMNEKHKNHMSKSNNCFSEAVGKKTRLDYDKDQRGRRLQLRRHPE